MADFDWLWLALTAKSPRIASSGMKAGRAVAQVISELKHFRYKVVAAVFRFLIVGRFLPVREFDLFAFNRFVGNEAQKMRNTVEPGTPLVVSIYDVPRRI